MYRDLERAMVRSATRIAVAMMFAALVLGFAIVRSGANVAQLAAVDDEQASVERGAFVQLADVGEDGDLPSGYVGRASVACVARKLGQSTAASYRKRLRMLADECESGVSQ